jgi:Protein of unknown function (DUF2849)
MAGKLKADSDQRLVVSASRLRDGRVVWRSANGWAEAFAAAAVLPGPTAVTALADAREDEARQAVVGAYLVEIGPDGRPASQRERIRAAGGPSIPVGLAA